MNTAPIATTTVTETLSEPRVAIMEQVTANLIPIISLDHDSTPRPRIRLEPPLLVPIARTPGSDYNGNIHSFLDADDSVIPPEPTDARPVPNPQVPTKQASPMPVHLKSQPARPRTRRVQRQSDAVGRIPNDPQQHKKKHRVTSQKKAAEISAKFHMVNRSRPASVMTMARNEMGLMRIGEYYPQDPAPCVPAPPMEVHHNNKTYFSL